MSSALQQTPRPLIDKERCLVVLWSAKSACTTVYVWFSSLCGFVEEVRTYDPWPHNHRENVFQKRSGYKDSFDYDVSSFHVVKIIRDPYSRAVSIFRQAIRYGLVNEDISFRRFLAMLSRLDMDAANVHFKPQWHPFESGHAPDTIINVSKTNLFGELNALERRQNWPVTDFAAMTWLHEIERERRYTKLPPIGKPCFAQRIIRSRPPKNTPFPDDAAFLTAPAKRMIEDVYEVDFVAYGDYL